MNKNDSAFILNWAKKIKSIEFLGGKCSNGDVAQFWLEHCPVTAKVARSYLVITATLWHVS